MMNKKLLKQTIGEIIRNYKRDLADVHLKIRNNKFKINNIALEQRSLKEERNYYLRIISDLEGKK